MKGGPPRRAKVLEALGGRGLLLGLFSLLSVAFGLIVLARESDRLRRTGRDALRPVIAGWVRTLPVDYLGSTLADEGERYQLAGASEKAERLVELRAALDRLGGQFDRPESRRAHLIEVVALELIEGEKRPLAVWQPAGGSRLGPRDLMDQVAILTEGPEGRGGMDLVVRYRLPAEFERAATGLEAVYHRLTLALLGLSLFPLLCLVYMVLQAGTLREQAAREAAQEATLDLADRTCHELGNVAFVLANEQRNLNGHLDLLEQFIDEGPAVVETAGRRAGLDDATAGRMKEALRREWSSRGLAPDIELRNALTIARDVCRQIAVCSNYIALTVRELDAYLKQSALPVDLVPVVVSECFDDVLDLLAPALDGSGVAIERDGAGLTVLADRRLLIHALVNLLKNAIEATRNVSGPRIGLTARAEGERAWIEVADNGPGVPVEQLRCVFTSGHSTKGPRRGRGLAIVRESIEAQGGRVEATSRAGSGATFRIELKVAS